MVVHETMQTHPATIGVHNGHDGPRGPSGGTTAVTDVSARRASSPARPRGPHPATTRAVDRRLRELDPRITSWAISACLAHADRGLTHVDDVANMMRWECAGILRRDVDETEPPAATLAFLRRAATRAADRYFHGSARTGLAGASGAARRASRARAVSGALATSLGRTPTAAEVVAEVNRSAFATRTDPVKQGALIRDDRRGLILETVALTEDLAVRPAFADEVHRRIETRIAVHRTLELCRAMGADLGEVADLWLSGALTDPPTIPTAAEIARRSSRDHRQVRRLLDECRAVAGLVCAELGLHPS